MSCPPPFVRLFLLLFIFLADPTSSLIERTPSHASTRTRCQLLALTSPNFFPYSHITFNHYVHSLVASGCPTLRHFITCDRNNMRIATTPDSARYAQRQTTQPVLTRPQQTRARSSDYVHRRINWAQNINMAHTSSRSKRQDDKHFLGVVFGMDENQFVSSRVRKLALGHELQALR